ncbi:efflux RND transporter permease subunit [Pleurocapsa sp. PCC 7319]|uniref:efflux RND transporter permease subunit n=1 Tax=Pleurocapsa sp. PCC 7319 TaxID=118161 RepID=UPI00034D5618|nr:efflux RND transporter permease subunit [Pleurocapsa sp. PCC 7319]
MPIVKSRRLVFLRDRFNLSLFAIAHPRLTLSFWLAVVVTGILAFTSLKYALFPDITFPVVLVKVQAPLETIIATEEQVTIPLERSLQSLSGLDEFISSTYAKQSIVTAIFDPGINLELATKDTREIVKQANLPAATTWEIIPFNLNESKAVSYTLTSDSKTLAELNQIAKTKIIPSLNQLEGVLKVNLLGDSTGIAKEQKIDFPTLVSFEQKNAIAIEIVKDSQANTLEIVEHVEIAIQSWQEKLPEVQINLAQTQADYIREATQATIDVLWLAILLAIIVIFGFLRSFTATLITALAIPISLLGTFIVMAIAGFNLETITLLALALTIGIIVDDAIVEVENIVRYLDTGYPVKEAVILATREIGFTVSVSTLTIVAVFLPIALMNNDVGQFFKPFGLTVSVAVITSLLVARTLTPVLAVYWLRKTKKKKREDINNQEIQPKTPHLFGLFSIYYRRLLNWSLSHRQIVLGIAVTSFAIGIALIPYVPKGFIPQLDRGEFNVIYRTPLPKLSSSSPVNNAVNRQNSARQKSKNFTWLSDLARSPEKILLRRTLRVGEQIEPIILSLPEVESTYNIVGIKGEPNQGKFYVKLKSDRLLNTAQVQEKLRIALADIPQAVISVENIPFIEIENQQNLQIALVGKDLVSLNDSAQILKDRVQQLPEFVDVTITGSEINGALPAKIEHFHGQRVVYLNANLSQGKAIGDGTAEVVAIARSIIPEGVKIELSGDSALSSDILQDFAGTLSLSVISMLLLLILPFGRILEPIVVGLCLPLSIIGAVLALLLTQSDFGMISLIGVIFLLGLLDKNALLLMDYTNQLRKSGLSRTKAILETGMVRLRPILMTTASTILGMMPIALGWGAGSELRQPMAVTIIGGLITSSLLSLILVPVLYTMLEDLFVSKGDD